MHLYERRHLARAACLHALCDSEARAIRRLGIANEVIVIPNGVDLPRTAPASQARKVSFLPEGKRILLYLGRLDPKKGLVALLKAWTTLRQRWGCAGDWALVLAGWDSHGHEAELRALVADQDPRDRAIFVGPVVGEAKDCLLRRASAFILPSFSEGLPVAVLEAWSYGLPVLMTSACNLPEAFDVGAAVPILPQAEALSRVLCRFISLSDGQRRAIGARGRALVKERFTWGKVATRFHALYQRLVNQDLLK